MENIDTYDTHFGKISLYTNDVYISMPFKNNDYWDINTLLSLYPYIDKSKSILELGAHCGTSTIVYAKFLEQNPESFLYAFEPQKKLFSLLQKNIEQNNLGDKIFPFQQGVFSYNGYGFMNNTTIDDDFGSEISDGYDNPLINCNFGGLSLGKNGEEIKLSRIDDLNLKNIGFVHADLQGAESFAFYHGKEFIKQNRPVIFYENNKLNNNKLYKNMCLTYPHLKEEKAFDLKEFCMNELNYSHFIHNFYNSIDTLLIP